MSLVQNLTFWVFLSIFGPKIFEISNFELEWCYIPQKKAEIMYNLDSARKSMIYWTKSGVILIFLIFASKLRLTKCLRSEIFQNFEKKFQKWICQDLLDIERKKVMKNEPIWSTHQKSTGEKPQGTMLGEGDIEIF